MKRALMMLMSWLSIGVAHAEVKVGDKAPEVSAPLSDGRTFVLSEWLPKAPIVLYFYPKDGTPGCTTEACALRDDSNAFRHLKATVVGASYDSVASHQAFVKKHNLPFPLIADTDKKVAKAFGVDRPLVARRATFIIDRDGRIVYANLDVNPRTHSQDIQKVLSSLSKG